MHLWIIIDCIIKLLKVTFHTNSIENYLVLVVIGIVRVYGTLYCAWPEKYFAGLILYYE